MFLSALKRRSRLSLIMHFTWKFELLRTRTLSGLQIDLRLSIRNLL